MLSAIWDILVDSALFLLLGFVLAGVIEALVAGRPLTKWISRPGFRSVGLATIVGLPLPLCSCSVLPTALTLRRQGASGGSTLAFLASTPETSVTSVALTYGLMGPWWAILRPINALVTAITAGVLEDWREPRGGAKAESNAQAGEHSHTHHHDHDHDHDHDHSHDHSHSVQVADTFVAQLRLSWHRAFGELFDDLFGWIMVGILFAAVIQVLLPPEWLLSILGGPWQSMLIMALIGIPLYVCAEASTPVAAAFLLAGVNPGAVLVFLALGPATNLGALGVLNRELGWRAVSVYLLAEVVVAFTVGAIIDHFYYSMFVSGAVEGTVAAGFFPEFLNQFAAILFLAMGIESIRRTKALRKAAGWLRSRSGIPIGAGGLAGVLILGLGVSYGASGLLVVKPGEVGLVQRFGKVTQSNLEPGLHFALPWPIERGVVVPVSEVRRELIGDEPRDPNDTERTPDGWVLVGDENIVDLQFSIHWHPDIQAADTFAFAVQDPGLLVRSAATAAIREQLGGLPVNRVLTSQRRAIEQSLIEKIQSRLQGYGSGIRVLGVQMLYGHAPDEVHTSFRDVASALEDRTTQVNQAHAFEAQLVPLTRGESAASRLQAEGYATSILHEARGDAIRFEQLRAAYSDWPEVTALRLELEMLERVLPGMWKYIKPPQLPDTEVEFWFTPSEARAVPPWVQPRMPD